MPRDLISAHQELCDTEVPQTQKTLQRCSNTIPQRQESVCDPDVMRIPGTTDNLHLQSKAWNRPKVSNALQQRETDMISPALSSQPSLTHYHRSAGRHFLKQDFAPNKTLSLLSFKQLTSCPVAASISRNRSRRDRTRRAALALLMEFKKGRTYFRSPPSSAEGNCDRKKYPSILGTKYPLKDDPR